MFGLGQDDRRLLWQRMRAPVLASAALLGLLGVNVLLGATRPFAGVWLVEIAVATAMVLVVLLVSMEVRHEPPLVRLFAGIGFFWVAILFAMTLVDYLTRAA
ncbi:MAG: oxidase [Methylobacterium frigidaeris]